MKKCTFPEFQISGCNKCPIATCSGKKYISDPKPLAQYLAEYLEQEKYDFALIEHAYGDETLKIDITDLKDNIEQALDAYESTQGVQIRIERVL